MGKEIVFPKGKGRGISNNSKEIIKESYNILNEINPATVRADAYRLFTAGLIPDMKTGTVAKVGKQLGYARDNGIIPWKWIVDENRSVERPVLWDDPDERLDHMISTYRRDNWQDQPNWVEVWSEKGTVRGILAPVLDEYGIPFRVQHGFGSKTVLHDVAIQTQYASKPLTILYVGDYDPSGMYMSEVDIPNRIGYYNGFATINRIALTKDDVLDDKGKEKLPSFPAKDKEKDPRYNWFVANYGEKCWELDALSPVTIRQRVENEIIKMLDMDIWNRSLHIEKVEVDAFYHYQDSWKESISHLVAKYSVSDTSQENSATHQ